MELAPIIYFTVVGMVVMTFLVLYIWDKRRIRREAVFTFQGHKFSRFWVDKNTKLPLLPAGWVWVVDLAKNDEGPTTQGYRRIAVNLLDDEKNDIGGYSISVWNTPKDAIKRLAWDIIDDMQRSIRTDWLDEYVGVYPPKTL